MENDIQTYHFLLKNAVITIDVAPISRTKDDQMKDDMGREEGEI